jgi:hypothetical protein
MGTMEHLAEYLGAAKTALDLFRGIRAEMPNGPLSDAAGKQIEHADKALRASEAELAKSFGYSLCQCTFPPQIMLWNEKDKANRCPNPECGKEISYRESPPARTNYF